MPNKEHWSNPRHLQPHQHEFLTPVENLFHVIHLLHIFIYNMKISTFCGKHLYTSVPSGMLGHIGGESITVRIPHHSIFYDSLMRTCIVEDFTSILVCTCAYNLKK